MSKGTMSPPIEILMVEDNPGDVRLAREALSLGAVPHNLHVMEDGEAAMSFLRQEAPYGDAIRPGLIILDLNLPRKHGQEVLGEIKFDERLKRIPVVIFTSSDSEEEREQCYERHANAFLTKPSEFDGFMQAVKSIEEFWLEQVILPSR